MQGDYLDGGCCWTLSGSRRNASARPAELDACLLCLRFALPVLPSGRLDDRGLVW